MTVTDGFSRFILIPILSEWLTLFDFVMYDSALCCHLSREGHLSIIRSNAYPFVSKLFSSQTKMPFGHIPIEWLAGRRFDLNHMIKFILKPDCWNDSLTNSCIDSAMVTNLTIGRGLLSFSNSLKSALSNLNQLTELHCADDVALRCVLKGCRNLKICNVTLRKQKEQMVSLLLRTNPGLQSLHIKALSVDYSAKSHKFSKWFVPSLIVHGTKVTSTNLNQCGLIKERTLQMFALHCCRSFTAFAYNGFSDVTLRTFIGYSGSKLRKLNLSHCVALTDCLIADMVEVCIQLEDLNVSYCPQLTDEAVKNIVTLNRLNSLSLQGLTNLTNASLASLCVLRDRLVSISLRRNEQFTESGLLLLSVTCRTVTSLTLQDLTTVLALLPTVLSSMLHLTSLDLSYNRTLSDSLAIEALRSLDCRKVVNVDLGGCELVTDETLIFICESCWYLESLSLHSCYYVTDAAVLHLAAQCKRLSLLNLAFTAVKDSTFEQMKRINPRLRIERNLL